jgi:hypothetical protein
MLERDWRVGRRSVRKTIGRVEWKWVKFECQATPGAQVSIGGTFNGWKPSGFDKLRDKKHDGNYSTLMQIRKGRHQYKFLVDGLWMSNVVLDVL